MNQRGRLFEIGALVALVFTSAGADSVRHSFESDPAITCDACAGWNAPIEPFRIYGNTYYVGVTGLSSVLVTSDRGHILLDGALPQSAEVIDRNIRRLGFRTEDVKLIVSSHAHFDHAGGIHALQRASGATVAASASGATALTRGENTSDDPQFAPGQRGNQFPRVRTVRIVKDGETLRMGPLSLTAHLTPGHTQGSTSWTWKSCSSSIYPQVKRSPAKKSSKSSARIRRRRKDIQLASTSSRIGFMRIRRKRAVDGVIRLTDAAGTVDVRRRAHPLDDGLHVDGVAKKTFGSLTKR